MHDARCGCVCAKGVTETYLGSNREKVKTRFENEVTEKRASSIVQLVNVARSGDGHAHFKLAQACGRDGHE